MPDQSDASLVEAIRSQYFIFPTGQQRKALYRMPYKKLKGQCGQPVVIDALYR